MTRVRCLNVYISIWNDFLSPWVTYSLFCCQAYFRSFSDIFGIPGVSCLFTTYFSFSRQSWTFGNDTVVGCAASCQNYWTSETDVMDMSLRWISDEYPISVYCTTPLHQVATSSNLLWRTTNLITTYYRPVVTYMETLFNSLWCDDAMCRHRTGQHWLRQWLVVWRRQAII